MANGNKVIINPEPHGRFVEYIVAAGETHYPGMIVQIQAATATINGVFTGEIYNADADGGRPKGPFIVVTENDLIGKSISDSYAAGERAFGYVPLPGDELNLLLLNIAGTADDHTKGEVLIVDDTTGKLIATTGSPETEVAMLLETVTDPTADTSAWCIWTGY